MMLDNKASSSANEGQDSAINGASKGGKGGKGEASLKRQLEQRDQTIARLQKEAKKSKREPTPDDKGNKSKGKNAQQIEEQLCETHPNRKPLPATGSTEMDQFKAAFPNKGKRPACWNANMNADNGGCVKKGCTFWHP